MSITLSRCTVAVLLLGSAAAHLPLIPEHLEEAPYVGVLFLLLSAACLVLAAAFLLVDRPALWLVSGALALAAITAFLASRTVGLPQLADDVGKWTEPNGFLALACEAGVVAASVVHLLRRAGRNTTETATPTHRKVVA